MKYDYYEYYYALFFFPFLGMLFFGVALFVGDCPYLYEKLQSAIRGETNYVPFLKSLIFTVVVSAHLFGRCVYHFVVCRGFFLRSEMEIDGISRKGEICKIKRRMLISMKAGKGIKPARIRIDNTWYTMMDSTGFCPGDEVVFTVLPKSRCILSCVCARQEDVPLPHSSP